MCRAVCSVSVIGYWWLKSTRPNKRHHARGEHGPRNRSDAIYLHMYVSIHISIYIYIHTHISVHIYIYKYNKDIDIYLDNRHKSTRYVYVICIHMGKQAKQTAGPTSRVPQSAVHRSRALCMCDRPTLDSQCRFCPRRRHRHTMPLLAIIQRMLRLHRLGVSMFVGRTHGYATTPRNTTNKQRQQPSITADLKQVAQLLALCDQNHDPVTKHRQHDIGVDAVNGHRQLP